MNGRAERKVEGGKLVRADVSFDEEIEDVELHGDFFVYPEEALDQVESALEGMSADTGNGQLAELVEDALEPGQQLVGFDAEDVSIVVREAIENAE